VGQNFSARRRDIKKKKKPSGHKPKEEKKEKKKRKIRFKREERQVTTSKRGNPIFPEKNISFLGHREGKKLKPEKGRGSKSSPEPELLNGTRESNTEMRRPDGRQTMKRQEKRVSFKDR